MPRNPGSVTVHPWYANYERTETYFKKGRIAEALAEVQKMMNGSAGPRVLGIGEWGHRLKMKAPGPDRAPCGGTSYSYAARYKVTSKRLELVPRLFRILAFLFWTRPLAA